MCRANNLTAERRAVGPTARRYDRPRAAAAGLVGTPILTARAAVLGAPLPRNRHLGREQFKKRGDYELSHVGTKGARQQRAAKQHQVELLAELKAEAIAEQSGAPGPDHHDEEGCRDELAFNDSVDSPGCTMAPRTPLAR